MKSGGTHRPTPPLTLLPLPPSLPGSSWPPSLEYIALYHLCPHRQALTLPQGLLSTSLPVFVKHHLDRTTWNRVPSALPPPYSSPLSHAILPSPSIFYVTTFASCLIPSSAELCPLHSGVQNPIGYCESMCLRLYALLWTGQLIKWEKCCLTVLETETSNSRVPVASAFGDDLLSGSYLAPKYIYQSFHGSTVHNVQKLKTFNIHQKQYR